MRLAVLISGSGSNLQAIIDAIENQQLDAEIVVVLSNQADAFGLQRAKQHGLNHISLPHQAFASREDFDQAMMNELDPYQPDYLVLAGFMRILTPAFIRHFEHRILNIHPSLLPKYPGLHTHRRVLENGDNEHGVSIHLVTEELDGGPLLLQGRYAVADTDSETSLAEKGHHLEHRMYPLVLQWLSQKRLKLKHGQPQFEGAPLEQPLELE